MEKLPIQDQENAPISVLERMRAETPGVDGEVRKIVGEYLKEIGLDGRKLLVAGCQDGLEVKREEF
ncbi:MAG TPA: hypothetical protein VEB60_01825 [Candidatus Paceibacterota bacterium]|nr:hypothetical protein [Candidatus Paceibacterota bacterium]